MGEGLMSANGHATVMMVGGEKELIGVARQRWDTTRPGQVRLLSFYLSILAWHTEDKKKKKM